MAVIKDDITHHYLLSKGYIENENFYVMQNYDGLLDLLDLRRNSIDLVLLNDDLLRNRVSSEGELNKYEKLLNVEDLNIEFNIACSLNTSAPIIEKLTLSMKSVYQSERYSQIKKKWKEEISELQK